MVTVTLKLMVTVTDYFEKTDPFKNAFKCIGTFKCFYKDQFFFKVASLPSPSLLPPPLHLNAFLKRISFFFHLHLDSLG